MSFAAVISFSASKDSPTVFSCSLLDRNLNFTYNNKKIVRYFMDISEKINKLVNCPDDTLIYLHIVLEEKEKAIGVVKKYIDCDKADEDEILQLFKQKYEGIDTPANAEARALLNKPKCPTCNSSNLKKISLTSKAVNTAVFGIFGTKRHKQFHCNNCGYEW